MLCGWIKVDGTDIDYPFVQTTDNSYYLNHSFTKEENKSGWIFLDYRNNINNLDKNSVKKVLTEQFEMKDINDSFLDAAGGSIKKALLIKEKSSEYEQITKLFDIIDKENLVNFINSASIIYENKDDIYNILDYINILLDIKIRSNSNNSFKFANCIFTVEEVKKRLRANSNYDMSIDYLLMNMWKEINGERSSRY